MDNMNSNNSTVLGKNNQFGGSCTSTNEQLANVRFRKCVKCGKTRSEANSTANTDSSSDRLTPFRQSQGTASSLLKSQDDDNLQGLKYGKSKEYSDKGRPSSRKFVTIKHHKKIQVDLTKRVKSASTGIQVDLPITDSHTSKAIDSKFTPREHKRNKSARRRSAHKDLKDGTHNGAHDVATSTDDLETAPYIEEEQKVGEDVVCCRCSLEVYKKRQEFNIELAEMRAKRDTLQQDQHKELQRFEAKCKERKDALTIEVDELIEKRKQAMAPVKMGYLKKETELLKKHGELNKLEDKLMGRIEDLSLVQTAVDQAEQDIIESENRIQRRQSILTSRQEVTAKMGQETPRLFELYQMVFNQEESATKAQSNSTEADKRRSVAQENWDVVRNTFQNRSEVLLGTLNNCKVQLAATENREMQLKTELNECKQKLRETEKSSAQKDKKIKDLQERLTMMIRQNLQPPETSSRKKSISIDQVPSKMQGDNTSGQFVYFSSQRRASVTPSQDSGGKRVVNGLSFTGNNGDVKMSRGGAGGEM